MDYDAALWGAVACTLTALGGVLSYLAWQRRGLTAALRGVAWSLLPLAAWLTGTLRLLAEVLGDIGHWAVHLVFSPTVWLGICVAGVAAVLFGVSGVLRGRRAGTDRSADALGPGGPRGQEVEAGTRGKGGRKHGRPDPVLEDAGEIEAILRKHGIR